MGVGRTVGTGLREERRHRSTLVEERPHEALRLGEVQGHVQGSQRSGHVPKRLQGQRLHDADVDHRPTSIPVAGGLEGAREQVQRVIEVASITVLT